MKIYIIVVGSFIDDTKWFLHRKDAKACLRFIRKKEKIPDYDLTVRIETKTVHERLPNEYKVKKDD